MTDRQIPMSSFFARLLTKPDFQNLLASIRNAGGATIAKIDDVGYEVTNDGGDLICRALVTPSGYLCRFQHGHVAC